MLERLGALGLMVALSSLAQGCGGDVDVGETGNGGGGGSGGTGGGETTSSTDGNGGGGGTDTNGTTSSTDGTGGGAAVPCEEACAVIVNGSCLDTASCTSYCEAESPAWPAEVSKAFAQCAAENPVCFMSMEGCILDVLHPPGSPRTVRLSGSGFQANEGKTLHVWVDQAARPLAGEAVITGGAFELEWAQPVQVFDTSGPLLLAYIDVDGDGECSATVDLTAAETPVWNGDYLDPVYELALTSPLGDPDFVCDFAP